VADSLLSRENGLLAEGLDAYPNLKAIIEGRIAGNFREWPAVRGELAMDQAELMRKASDALQSYRLASSETKDAADAARWRALKEMAGYYQDGSQTTVKLYQDDALRSCFIEAGGKTYGTDGSSFDSAIDSYRHTKED
jgi:hypothetical protein